MGIRIGGGIGGIIGGIGAAIGGVARGVGGCYSGCGGHYGGYGSGFFGVSLGVPHIEVNVEKSYEAGCTTRRCKKPEVHVVRNCGCNTCPCRPVVHKEVEVKKEVDGDFAACPNCGGATKPKKETKPTVTVTRTNLCPVQGEVCCRSKPHSRVPETCGQRNVCGVDRKTGSASKPGEADFGEYPWQVTDT